MPGSRQCEKIRELLWLLMKFAPPAQETHRSTPGHTGVEPVRHFNLS